MKKKSSTNELRLSSNERLFSENTSPFNPKKYSNLTPNGFKIYTFKSGFKKFYDDLLIIIFDEVIDSINIYSKTSTPSAPILWDKKNNKGKVKALIVNAGNANAHTGNKGIKIINEYVKILTKLINCKKSEVLVSSTGVIGETFNPNIINKQILKLNNKKPVDLLTAAKSIMTTDTYPKTSIKNIVIDSHKIKIYGIAKGSGMIMPNMATMLVYIFIESKIQKSLMKKLIKNNLDDTFNSISVDSDTSTSDTLFLFCTNHKKANFNIKKNFNLLNLALFNIMEDLALQVIKDGEGLSKLIKVNVLNAKTKSLAKNIGFSIVNSPLVKSAISGEDANWGRIIMAIGKTQEKIDQNKLKVFFGKNLVCKNGSINKKINLSKINKYMKKKLIEINIILNNGLKKHTVYGNDLNYEYLRINRDYRS